MDDLILHRALTDRLPTGCGGYAKPPHATAPAPTEPPGEAHRGGPLPYQKR